MIEKKGQFFPTGDSRLWVQVQTDMVLDKDEDCRLLSETSHFGQHVRVYFMTNARYEEILSCQG